MKLILALTLISLTSISFASGSKTLADYDASRNYIVAWPTVVFSNLSVPVKNVCVDGENLKTIAPVKYCSKQAVIEVCTKINSKSSEECSPVAAGSAPSQKPGTRLVYGCVAYNTNSFSTTRTYQAQVCTKWETVQTGSHNNTSQVCTEFGTEAKDYALSYDVSVSAMATRGQRVEVDSLNFTIPACK